MSYLVSMQLNIKIDLFVVAPNERRETITFEIKRLAFAGAKSRPWPGSAASVLHPSCGWGMEQIGR